MQINTQSVRANVTPAVVPESPKPATVGQPGVESFAAKASLDEALHQVPDVRKSEIERATRLVESSGYPPQELIHRLSRLLADELSQS